MKIGDAVLYEFEVFVITGVRPEDRRIDISNGWIGTGANPEDVFDITQRNLSISRDYQSVYREFQNVQPCPFNMPGIKQYMINSWCRALCMTDEEYKEESRRITNFTRTAMDAYKTMVDGVFIFWRR